MTVPYQLIIKKLSEGLVFVIYKWKWESGDGQEQSSDNEDVDDPYPPSDEEDHQDVDDKFESSLVTHSVIFKCVGTNKCQWSQEILAEAAKKLKNGHNVEVMLKKEPTNPKDSRAIAFHCKLV